MNFTRRSTLSGALWTSFAALPLIGCAGASSRDPNTTRVYVLGVIHSGHLRSDTYSLAVLEAAIRKAAPDVILSEIPPDRIGQAVASFAETGEIDEPRTQVFPEYTDVVFPLSQEMGFRIMGTAGWTRDLARNRRAALDQIENDPARAEQWAEHRAALRHFSREVAGRGDDPLFIHTEEFDQLVEASRAPYQRFFDEDLGPGGWTAINRAHTDLINSALDSISGEGLTAVIMFGNAHKYLILRSLEGRDDVELGNARDLFR